MGQSGPPSSVLAFSCIYWAFGSLPSPHYDLPEYILSFLTDCFPTDWLRLTTDRPTDRQTDRPDSTETSYLRETSYTTTIVYKGLNTALAAIRIVISGIIVAIVVTFIHQSGSLSDSNLNFALTIQGILLSPLIVEIIHKFINLFSF